jgi:hypothetical protein
MQIMRVVMPVVVLALLAGLIGPSGASAASLGNPIDIEEPKQLAVGFESEYYETQVSDESVVSKRYLAKASWSVSRWADVVLRAGAGDIDVDAIVARNAVHFDSDPRFAWGGGIRLEPWRSETLPMTPRLVVAAEGLVLLSSGSVNVDLAFPNVTLRERFDADYRWREFQTSAAVVFDANPIYPYAGLALRGIDGTVKRRQFDLTGITESLVSDVEEDFGSGTSPYLMGGLDYRVGPTFRLSAEGYFQDSDDFGFFFGLSERSH